MVTLPFFNSVTLVIVIIPLGYVVEILLGDAGDAVFLFLALRKKIMRICNLKKRPSHIKK